MLDFRSASFAALLSSTLALGACSSGDADAGAYDSMIGLETAPALAAVDTKKAELGKMLFFDKRISLNNDMSCETCHLHDKGWTDGKQFATKFDGSMFTRNSPSLYNMAWQEAKNVFYWDGRATSLPAQIKAAWTGGMGAVPDQAAATLNGIAGYKEAFQSAYGGPATGDNIPDALAHFVRTLISGGSLADRALRPGGDVNLIPSAAEAGSKVFNKAGCITCHIPPLYTDYQFHTVGIGWNEEKQSFSDLGRKGVKDQAIAAAAVPGSFKTPSLRSVGKTAPYFHDGSVATLEEAVHTMATGGIKNPHKDPLLAFQEAIKLSDAEIASLVAFLKSLSSDEPFVRPTLPQ